MLICEICGHEFEPSIDRHYIARDPGVTGAFFTLGSYNEDKLYDAFDCPKCGCQMIMKERKHKVKVPQIGEGEEDEDDEDEDEDDA